MPSIQIITDSACDLPSDLIGKYGIEVVPLTIRIDGQEYVDQVDLSTEEFWAKCRNSPRLPETAAPSPGSFLDSFKKAEAAGKDGVVCITISSGLSATYQSATNATAEEGLGIQVSVIDSKLVTLAHGFVVLAAAELAQTGASIEQVSARVEECITQVHAFATLDTLENLRKGGRIGGAQALLGSVLSIKPVVQLIDGKVEPESRQRTRSKALTHLIEATKACGIPEVLGLAHGDASDIDTFHGQVSSAFPGVDIIVSRMGAVLGTHVGEGTMTLVSRMPSAR